jgi:hypothetical protein
VLNASGSSAPIVLIGMLYLGFKFLTSKIPFGKDKSYAGWQVLLTGLFGHGLLKAFGAIGANGEINPQMKEKFGNLMEEGKDKYGEMKEKVEGQVEYQNSLTGALKIYENSKQNFEKNGIFKEQFKSIYKDLYKSKALDGSREGILKRL